MDELLSIKEAARKMGGLSTYTIQSWLSKGRVPRTKVGARTMIRLSDLEAFVAKCNEPARASASAAKTPSAQ